jgi:cytochrome c5
MTTDKVLTVNDAEALLHDSTRGPWSAVYPVTSSAPLVINARGDLVFQLAPVRGPLTPLPDLRLVAAAPELAASVAHWHRLYEAATLELEAEREAHRAKVADLERLYAETCAECDEFGERCALLQCERDELAYDAADGRETLRWIAQQAGVGDVPLGDIPERVIQELTTARHLVDLAVTERDEARAELARVRDLHADARALVSP